MIKTFLEKAVLMLDNSIILNEKLYHYISSGEQIEQKELDNIKAGIDEFNRTFKILYKCMKEITK